MNVENSSQTSVGSDQSVADTWDERLYQAVYGDGFLPEIFKVLRSRILHPLDDAPVPRTVLVTSVMPAEGKSFITANLGISLAQGMDQYSLLVDCDMRQPALAGLFGMSNKTGLADYLRDDLELSELIRKTPVDKLTVLSSGKPPQNPSELLGSARMKTLVRELAQRYDDRFIIFDTPPARAAAETVVLAGLVDAVILVVKQRGAGRDEIRRFIEIVGPEKVLGLVFNGQTTSFLAKSLLKTSNVYYQIPYGQ